MPIDYDNVATLLWDVYSRSLHVECICFIDLVMRCIDSCYFILIQISCSNGRPVAPEEVERWPTKKLSWRVLQWCLCACSTANPSVWLWQACSGDSIDASEYRCSSFLHVWWSSCKLSYSYDFNVWLTIWLTQQYKLVCYFCNAVDNKLQLCVWKWWICCLCRIGSNAIFSVDRWSWNGRWTDP